MFHRARRGYLSVPAAAVLLMASVVPGASPVRAEPLTPITPPIVAEYAGSVIPNEHIPRYHCHDSGYPIVRCFATEAERDADFTGSRMRTASLDLTPPAPELFESHSSSYFVTWYEHRDYLGGSFTTSNNYPDLGVMNWQNLISSFKSRNGGRPQWWFDANYCCTSATWPAGAWVSFVGTASNDQFESVRDI